MSDLEVKYNPLPTERVLAWRAGLLLLLKWIERDCNAAQPISAQNFMIAAPRVQVSAALPELLE